jgi:hypothetical protein
MGRGDEVTSLSPGVLDEPMRQVHGRPGRTQSTKAQVPRRSICRCDASAVSHSRDSSVRSGSPFMNHEFTINALCKLRLGTKSSVPFTDRTNSSSQNKR